MEQGSWEWSQERCSSLGASLAVLKDQLGMVSEGLGGAGGFLGRCWRARGACRARAGAVAGPSAGGSTGCGVEPRARLPVPGWSPRSGAELGQSRREAPAAAPQRRLLSSPSLRTLSRTSRATSIAGLGCGDNRAGSWSGWTAAASTRRESCRGRGCAGTVPRWDGQGLGAVSAGPVPRGQRLCPPAAGGDGETSNLRGPVTLFPLAAGSRCRARTRVCI